MSKHVFFFHWCLSINHECVLYKRNENFPSVSFICGGGNLELCNGYGKFKTSVSVTAVKHLFILKLTKKHVFMSYFVRFSKYNNVCYIT